jgi:anti-sigma regulatory factor (Ser/Thr protein kinase)
MELGASMAPTEGWSHETVFQVGPRSPSEARAFVQRQLEDHGLPALVDDVGLVATELATNAVKHAGTPFAVVITGSSSYVMVAVRDASDGAPVPASAKKHDLGGRGLAIVEQVSRDWGVTTSGGTKAVWARFDTR